MKRKSLKQIHTCLSSKYIQRNTCRDLCHDPGTELPSAKCQAQTDILVELLIRLSDDILTDLIVGQLLDSYHQDSAACV